MKFFQNAAYAFIEKRRAAYVVSAVVLAICAQRSNNGYFWIMFSATRTQQGKVKASQREIPLVRNRPPESPNRSLFQQTASPLDRLPRFRFLDSVVLDSGP